MIRIEHIGIAVKDLAAAEERCTPACWAWSYKREAVESEGVITSFFQHRPQQDRAVGEHTCPTAPSPRPSRSGARASTTSPSRWRTSGRRWHGLKAEGFTLLNEEPKRGADNKLVCFVHPKSANGVLVELCQEMHD
jgi:methylmalonyl-CoA/ethylmalonyl-CoA epimerase